MKNFNDVLNCIWINNHYYMLKNKSIIDVYDDNLTYIESLNIDKEYTLMAYNDEENVFYLYQLNSKSLYKSINLKSFEPLKLPINCLDKVKHISYCKCYNSILITTKKSIFMLDLCRKHIKTIYKVKEEVKPINDCMGPLGSNISSNFTLIGTVCCCKDIYVAYRINNMNFISKLENGELGNIVYKTCSSIQSIFIISNEIWILVTKDCQQELIYTGIDCDCNEGCHKDCNCEIIESVASIEKSIAKILNSESLKIKAAINKSENVKDLIGINSSVSEVIYYVTVLEFILAEKLKVIKKNNI